MSNTDKIGEVIADQSHSGLELFADETGKEVFNAFEKLGDELNILAENLERQCEDDESDGVTAALDSIDVKEIISASVSETTASQSAAHISNSEKKLSHSDSLDNLLEIITDSVDQGSSPVRNGQHSLASASQESLGDSPQKISQLINSLRIRSQSHDEASSGGRKSSSASRVDEWVNDDDTGYNIITLSEEEFYDYEEETSARILQERKEQAMKAKINATKAAPAKQADKSVPSVAAEASVYEGYDSEGSEKFVDLTTVDSSVAPTPVLTTSTSGNSPESNTSPIKEEKKVSDSATPVTSPSKEAIVTTSTDERATAQAPRESVMSSPVAGTSASTGDERSPSAQLAVKLVENGSFGTPRTTSPVTAPQSPPQTDDSLNPAATSSPVAESTNARPLDSTKSVPVTAVPNAPQNRRQSVGEQRRLEIMGQKKFQGVDGVHCYFNLKVIFEPYKTGFEENKDLQHHKGTILAGRYEVHDVLGTAAFSTALQCVDLAAEDDEAQWVCLKVIKNNKDFFDQSLDEIKLLQYINSCGDPDKHHVLRLIDFFYCKEHLFIVSELLKENLYEFGRFIRENGNEPYYTMPRLKRIMKQVLEALVFIHSLKLIHCDIKPENIVIKSFSRCEVKLIDFGSSCFTTDHLTTYIQSRSYRAPEVIIGHPYDTRIDIWSVGAVLAELHTGYVLFQNDSVATMLSRITGILGAFPQNVLQRGKDTGKYFSLSNIVYERDEEGSFHLIFPKKTDLASRLHMPENPTAGFSADEIQFVDFVRQMLHLDPAQRMSAEQALAHPWLADADTVYVSEYIIGQNTNAGYAPPVPGGQYEYDDEEEGSEDDEDYDYEGDSQDNSEDDSGDYEFDLPGADYDAAESEEAALQYLMAHNSTSQKAMEAYYMLQQLQAQQLPDMSFAQDDDEMEESESVEGEYFEGLEGSEDASSADEQA